MDVFVLVSFPQEGKMGWKWLRLLASQDTFRAFSDCIWQPFGRDDTRSLKWLTNLHFWLSSSKSNYLYTDKARKMRDKYKVVLDTPEYRKVQELKTHLSEVRRHRLPLHGRQTDRRTELLKTLGFCLWWSVLIDDRERMSLLCLTVVSQCLCKSVGSSYFSLLVKRTLIVARL